MNIIKKSALVLTLIGALNWGLIGIFDFNLVAAIFGDMTVAARIIYSLVGIAFTFVSLLLDSKIYFANSAQLQYPELFA